MRARLVAYGCVIVALVATVVSIGAGTATAAAESCTYDSGSRVVTATIETGSAAVLRIVGGVLEFGATPVPCSTATSANTDSIQVVGAPGSTERLTIDLSSGALGPGATAEGNVSEIEVSTTLGDVNDQVAVLGTPGPDSVAMGQNGLSLNSDGDVDVTFAPLPARVEIAGGAGKNALTGRGGWGAGPAFAGAVVLTAGDEGDELNGANGDDVLTGGAGADILNGNDGADRIDGLGGSDKVSGGNGGDYLVGGAGSDTFTGGSGNDFLIAFDLEADASINGGGDVDVAFYDSGLDLSRSALEAQFPGPPVESCVYDPVTRAIAARPAPGVPATLKVAPSGEILFGFVPQACGAATSTNTDSISVTGFPGVAETLTLDQTDAVLGPGFTAEGNIPEIELATSLGDATDRLVVIGTAGDDVIAAGQNGLALNSDGDLDVTLSPGAHHVEVRLLGGNDFFNGRGQGGAGLAYLGPLTVDGGEGDDELVGGLAADVLDGGGGADTISAQAGDDRVLGGPGDDFLTASEGNDTVIGGPGADNMSGGFGADFIDADDGEADVQINGGPDADTAHYDAGLDPATIAVETAIADPGSGGPPPPPPPPGACAYDAAAKSVTATMPSGGTATLAVVSGQIQFGALPAQCGSATTSNTDSVTVTGPAGSTEELVLDLSQGALAPGVAAESNTPEIELSVALGDTADRVVVIGTSGNDTLAAGANGLSLNGDGDVDVTFAQLPSSMELRGGGGVNFLSGRGGFGAGLAFPGSLTLVAGDQGDEMNGAGLADVIVGGAGNDVVLGFGGDDQISGGDGNDSLSGSDGNDTITGGPGADSLLGGFGADTLRADDGVADTQIHGGADVDLAYVDDGVDPPTIAVENKVLV